MIKIYDNIGSKFIQENNNLLIGASLLGFRTLSTQHCDSVVPYLIKNKEVWETGLGLVKNLNDKIYVERIRIIRSSNNDDQIDFSNLNSEHNRFYVFANEFNFATNLHNAIQVSKNVILEPISATYLLDLSENLEVTLPSPQDYAGLSLEFKTNDQDKSCKLISNITVTLLKNSYLKLISDGIKWIQLVYIVQEDEGLSVSGLSNSELFSSLSSDPAGNTGSLQYNNGGVLGEAPIYLDPNKKLLLGDILESSARTILPTSGNYPTIFNNDESGSHFIVKGSGSDRNLFFTYDGKLGINMPTISGDITNPSTLLHIVNNNCRQGIRLENRGSCPGVVPNITLYHKPSGSLSSGTNIGSIVLAAKDSTNVERNYATLSAAAVSSTAGTAKGRMDFRVLGNNQSLVSVDPDRVILGYNNHNISINPTGISFNSNNIVLTNASGVMNSPNIKTSKLTLSNITENKLLSVGASGEVVSKYSIDDFFVTNKDITWNRYPTRRVKDICPPTRQITFLEPVPVEEFSVGDQLIFTSSSATFYRTVSSIEINNSVISSMLLDSNILADSIITDVKVLSVTKGAYLSTKIYTEPGSEAVSDSTENILSIRPGTATEFNIKQKDLDFVVYSTSATPALKITSSELSQDSGSYNIPNLLPILINSSGYGLNNQNFTANFSNVASGYWPSMRSIVGTNGLPSYYGIYDMHGNASEWLCDGQEYSVSITREVAGGSWNTSNTNGLHAVETLNYNDHNDQTGFRIKSIQNLTDNAAISEDLGITFSSVSDINNQASISGIFVLNSSGNYVKQDRNNLGVVPYSFRISNKEITNEQYAKFLNSVAYSGDPYNLYNNNMSGIMGGILKNTSGSESIYHAMFGLEQLPVVYVSYLDAIRFTNWLDNGAPVRHTGSFDITEDGSYQITFSQSQQIVKKNKYGKYYLPTLNEWYKAAYYKPISQISISGSSRVLINTNTAYENNGQTASLTNEGFLYTDNIRVNNALITEENRVILASGGLLTVGESVPVGSIDYITSFSNNGIILASRGDVEVQTTGEFFAKNITSENVSTLNISANSGEIDRLTSIDIFADTISARRYVNSAGQDEELYAGPEYGVVYKSNSGELIASNKLFITDEGIVKSSGVQFKPLYLDNNFIIQEYSPLNLGNNSVTLSGSYHLSVPNIIIGSTESSLSGSLLTHQGSGYASWEKNDYLSADGVRWDRNTKREVVITKYLSEDPQNTSNQIIFTDNAFAVNSGLLLTEFPVTDTIAIVNKETKDIQYIKLAVDGATVLVDGSGTITTDPIFYSTGRGPASLYCSNNIPWFSGNVTEVNALAYSVNRGGYFSMQLDPLAVSNFGCVSDSPDTPYTFKPGTLNVISTRPDKATVFNTIGEPIDFAVYGRKKLPFNRYQSNIYELNQFGLSSGLIPAIKIDNHRFDSVSGSIPGGVSFSGYIDLSGTIPTGYILDESAKICINTNDPYIVGSIVSGTNTLNTYADLTVRGISYSKNILTDNIVIDLNNARPNQYIINSPLVINSNGQIVSQKPPVAATTPLSPSGLNGVGSNSSIYLEWIAPSGDGGATITNYSIQYSLSGRELVDSGSGVWTQYNSRISSTNTFENIYNLTNGLGYIFRVAAINRVGLGPFSSTSSEITPNIEVPKEPTNLSVTRGVNTIFSWSAPTMVGTSPIISYSADRQTFGETSWISLPVNGSNTSLTITGLTLEPTYIFRVRAINSEGAGSYNFVTSSGTGLIITQPEANEETANVWDFGKVIFSGVCL